MVVPNNFDKNIIREKGRVLIFPSLKAIGLILDAPKKKGKFQKCGRSKVKGKKTSKRKYPKSAYQQENICKKKAKSMINRMVW